MGVVFVAGVHAVGKTTVCALASRATGVPHVSASDLIRSEKAAAIAKRGKAVLDVAANQLLLVRAVKRAVRETRDIILDGHFTIQNSLGHIDKVGVDVFRDLAIVGAVIYQDNPVAISVRLEQRDSEHRDPDAIAAHQEAEIHHGRAVAESLGAPLLVLDAFDSTTLVETVLRWTST